jgi:hypothetical protein
MQICEINNKVINAEFERNTLKHSSSKKLLKINEIITFRAENNNPLKIAKKVFTKVL